ncbi:tetratricopeptide repeat protein [Kamptonema formosum]|uniref:tetratricopeptide repeat protein n=1 Tax=Kamptonema formosum TaxID=331992 RepID=UPI00034A2AD2|nr:tetratricopeptide repeat protein [Oscillatoria sp. PCC 10802]
MKKSWLDIAEYLSLAGAIAGTAAAAATQQVVLAAAPVSLSLALNMANRRKLERFAEQNPAEAALQVQQKLSTEVESLRTSLKQLPTQEDLTGVKQAIAVELRNQERFSGSSVSAVREELSNMQKRYGELLETVSGITARLENFSPKSKLESLESGLASSSESLALVSSKMTQLQADLEQLASKPAAVPEPVRAQLEDLYRRVNSIPDSQPQLAELRNALAKLQEDAKSLTSRQDFLTLQQMVAPFADSVPELTEQLADLRAQVSRGEEMQAANAREEAETFRRILAEVNRRIDEIPPPPEPVDLTGVREELSHLAAATGETKADMERRLAPLEALDLNPLRENISELRQRYASLGEWVAVFAGGVSLAEKVASLQSAAAELAETVAGLQQEVAQQPDRISQQLQPQLQEFRIAAAQLEQDVNNRASKQDVASLEQVVAGADSALSDISVQLHAVTSQVNHLSEETVQRALQQLDELRGVLTAVSRRIDELPPLPPPADLSPIEAELARLASNLTETREGMDSRIVPLEALESRIVPLETLESRIAPLETLESRIAPLETLESRIAPLETLESRIAPLETLESRIAPLETLESRIAPLETLDLQRAHRELTEQQQQYAALIALVSTLSPTSRVENVENALAAISRRIDELPTPPAAADLSSIEAELAALSSNLREVQERMESRLAALEALDLEPAIADISELKQQYAAVRALGDTDPPASGIQELERSVAEISRRIEEWDARPETANLSAVRETLDKIVESVASAKAELSGRIAQLEALELESLREQFNRRSEPWQVEELKQAIDDLHRRFENFPSPPEPVELTGVEQALAKMIDSLADTKQQLSSRISPLEESVNPLRAEISELQAALDRVERSHVGYLQSAVTELQSEVENLAAQPQVGRSEAELLPLVEQAVERRLGEVNELLKNIGTPEMKLVFDRPGTRTALFEALSNAQERVIIVCPWLSRSGIDRTLLDKLEAFLQRKGKIDIGWGNLGDIDAGQFPRRINQQWQAGERTCGYDALNDLELLKSKYPKQLRLKVLGTHENFAVWDSAGAIITSHHFLSAGAGYPEREVGVIATDPRIVQGLIDRFTEPVLSPATADSYRKRGFERLNVRDYQGAVEDYTRALELNPNSAITCNDRGVALSSLADQPAAIADYTKALELDPNEPVYYFNRGFARFNQEDFRGAIEDYSQVIRLSPEKTDAYFHRAEAYRLLGECQSAADGYTQVLRVNPEDAVSYNNRGLAQYELGNRQQAIEDYTQALRINPDDAVAYFNRGVAHFGNGEFLTAIEDFNDAIRLNPQYAAAYKNRGLTRLELGDRQLASQDLQKAAELFSYKGDAQNRQAVLEALQKLQQK